MPKPKISPALQNPRTLEQTQPEASQDQTVVNSDGSTVTGNRYANPFFRFTFDFPKDWVVHSNAVAKKTMDENKKKLVDGNPELAAAANRPDVSAPLLAASEATAYGNSKTARTVKLLVSDVSGEKRQGTAVDYLNSVAAMAREKKLPIEFLSTPEAITVNGKKLAKAYLKMPWEGSIYYVAMYALEEKKYMLQFMFTSPEREGLASLEPWMQTLQFADKASQP
jgi:hypothetical protein